MSILDTSVASKEEKEKALFQQKEADLFKGFTDFKEGKSLLELFREVAKEEGVELQKSNCLKCNSEPLEQLKVKEFDKVYCELCGAEVDIKVQNRRMIAIICGSLGLIVLLVLLVLVGLIWSDPLN